MTGPKRSPLLPPYREPVGGIGVRDLPPMMSAAAVEMERRFPGLFFVLVVGDWGPGGGAAHVTNGDRDSCVGVLREYCDEIERRYRTQRGAL